jgi:hypothetical protein
MRSSPSIAPSSPPDDIDIYIVLDNFGSRLGRAWRETDEESTDRRSLVIDLIDGQYSDPARIVVFNTAEGWSRSGRARKENNAAEASSHSAQHRTNRAAKDEPHARLTFEEMHPAGKQTVAGMVAKGWIEKQPDGRTFCITPAGDAALKTIIPVTR